eukprot:212473_1
MNQPCTAYCTNKSNCRCYKCSIKHAIKTHRIAIHLPKDIILSIVSYIGKYSIYGKIGTQYKIQSHLSNIIAHTEDICITENHAFIHSFNGTLFHSINGSNPARLDIKQSTILSSISIAFSSFFARNNSKNTTDKAIIVRTFKMYDKRSRYIVVKCESLKVFEITYDELGDAFKMVRLFNIEDAVKSFHPDKTDRLKKVVYNNFLTAGPRYLWARYCFLFESGRLIEVPSVFEMQPYPGSHGRLEKAIESSETFRDIAVGSRHALMISTGGRVWTRGDNRDKQCGSSSSRIPNNMYSLCPLFRNQNIKSVHCGADSSCVVLANGMCHLFGVLRCLFQKSLFQETKTINFSNQKSVTLFQEFDGFSDIIVVDVAFGSQHIIVLDDGGNVYGIGSNEHKQISITNTCKLFKTPYRIARREINMACTKHRIIKVIADGNNSYFVTNVD